MTRPVLDKGETFGEPSARYAALPVSFPATAASVLVVGGGQLVTWLAFTETTGAAAASLTVFDGVDATGQEICTVNLNAKESVRDTLGHRGLWFTRGIFVQVTAGSVRGTFAVVNT